MLISKKRFEEIKHRHNITIITDDDVGVAFEFVQELLEAEVDALKEEYPHATNSIRDMEKAAYEVSNIGNEIKNDEFEGE